MGRAPWSRNVLGHEPRVPARRVYAARAMGNASVLRGLATIPAVRRLIELALDEDLGRGDATSGALFTPGHDPQVVAEMNTREPIVAFGLDVAAAVFHLVDPSIDLEAHASDGARVPPGGVLLTARGPARTVLAAERTALNFTQRLSGVATLSKRYADAVAAISTTTRVVDTRKTTPGFRVLEKAAVLSGGCWNHRFDLGSGVLIKDNHIAALGSVGAAVAAAKARAPHPLRIEVEVTNLSELEEALAAGAEIVLLDNMTPAQVEVAAARAHLRNVIVEVSGGITLTTIGDYARAGADLISVGALTHSAPAVDIGLDVRTSAGA